MRIDLPRRTLLALGTTALLARPSLARAAGEVVATDLLGRRVALARPARRVVLLQGRHIAVLNLLMPDPAGIVVGWSNDWLVGAVDEMRAYARRFPGLATVPVVARMRGDIDGETLLTLQPDLVLFSRTDASRDGQRLFPLLEGAGIATAVIDFFLEPLRDTAPSLRLLGTLLGREEQAAALLAFHEAGLARIRQSMEGLADPDRPRVMIHAHAGGTPCCYSPGRGTFDSFIRLTGGTNMGAERIATATGQLSLEYVLTEEPGIYIATGGSYNGRGGVELGAGIGATQARQSLWRVLRDQKLEGLAAVRNGRAHALWHGCNDSPAHLLAIEALATWIQPARTAGLHPARTLEQLNTRFAAVPMEGSYWIDAGTAG